MTPIRIGWRRRRRRFALIEELLQGIALRSNLLLLDTCASGELPRCQ